MLTLAMADPLDFETIAAVRAFSGCEVRTVLAPEQEILDAIEKYYGETEREALGVAKATTAGATPTWNTCATWPARRRSSAW